jgi:hypothetical protein
MLPGMSDVARVSAVLRWSGRLLAVAGVVVGLMPVSDECGSAFQPSGMYGDAAECVGALAGRLDTAVVLLVIGVVGMLAGQIMGWRSRPDAG